MKINIVDLGVLVPDPPVFDEPFADVAEWARATKQHEEWQHVCWLGLTLLLEQISSSPLYRAPLGKITVDADPANAPLSAPGNCV